MKLFVLLCNLGDDVFALQLTELVQQVRAIP
jgi:hypothetical protein